jgi:3-hydroxybutyryl-CoA dehydrogenase
MGIGIAHAFAVAGPQVTVVESSPESAEAARERFSEVAEKSERHGTRVRGALTVETDPQDLGHAQLVVEAVPENLELKRQVLARAAALAPTAVLATNTSALSIDTLADGLPDPSRFVGLHFFNPVPVSALVEIVAGSRTSSAVLARARDWVEQLGKTAITVTDSPGFASSRLGLALALEAIRMVEDGVASAADIDAAMTLGYRHQAGPLRTTDIVGLDVRLAIAEHLERELGPRFAPPALLREKVAAGELGRKSGAGFFTW